MNGSQPYPILVGVCAALTMSIVYQLWAPLSAPTVPHRKTAPAILPPSIAMPVFPPGERFAIVSERPLFDAQRKKFIPPKEDLSKSGAPPPPPNVALVGIIIDRAQSVAIMKPPDAALAASMAIGESIGGWRLSSIQADSVVLTEGTNSNEIRLDANKPSAAARQDVSAPQLSLPNDATKSTAPSPRP